MGKYCFKTLTSSIRLHDIHRLRRGRGLEIIQQSNAVFTRCVQFFQALCVVTEPGLPAAVCDNLCLAGSTPASAA